MIRDSKLELHTVAPLAREIRGGRKKLNKVVEEWRTQFDGRRRSFAGSKGLGSAHNALFVPPSYFHSIIL